MGLEVAESLPAGSGEDWLCWRALNRMRTGVGRAKTVMRRWGYLDDAQSVDCDCGEPQTMAQLLSCRLLDEACTADDLATVTERAMACARKWEKVCEGHERRRICKCIPFPDVADESQAEKSSQVVFSSDFIRVFNLTVETTVFWKPQPVTKLSELKHGFKIGN